MNLDRIANWIVRRSESGTKHLYFMTNESPLYLIELRGSNWLVVWALKRFWYPIVCQMLGVDKLTPISPETYGEIAREFMRVTFLNHGIGVYSIPYDLADDVIDVIPLANFSD